MKSQDLVCLLCEGIGRKHHSVQVDALAVLIRLCLSHSLEYFSREGFVQFGKDIADLVRAYRASS